MVRLISWPKKPLADVVLAEHLRELQQQRPGAACRVVDLVDLGLAHHRDPRQQLGDLLRGEELTAGLACARGVHRHQVLVGVAERVDGVAVEVAEVQVADGVEQLHELLVALRDGRAELGAVDVEVVEQALEVVLADSAPTAGPLDVGEDPAPASR